MEVPLFALIIAAIAGMAMALQGSFNAILGKIIGTLETTLVVHLIGIAVVIIALFLFKLGTGNLALIKNAPWYTFLGGVLGVLIIFGVAVSIPRTGVANATTAIITGQLLTASDYRPAGLFDWKAYPLPWKGLGLACLAAGGYFMLCR